MFKLFLKAYPYIRWDKIGNDRVKMMSCSIRHLTNQLSHYLGLNGCFLIVRSPLLNVAAEAIEIDSTFYRAEWTDDKDQQLATEAYGLMAHIFHEMCLTHSLAVAPDRLIFNPALAGYAFENFFLNNGSSAVQVDLQALSTPWRSIALKSGKEIAETSRLIVAQDVFRRPGFEVLAPTGDLPLGNVELSVLGFPGDATLQDVQQRVRQLGFFLCPPHLAPQLWDEYEDQPVDEMLHPIMNAIPGDRGMKIFHLTRSDTLRWIDVENGHPSKLIEAGSRIVYCLTDPYPNKEMTDLAMATFA